MSKYKLNIPLPPVEYKWGFERQEGRYSYRSICFTTEKGQRVVMKEIFGDMPPLRLENYWREKMNCCDGNGNCTQGADCAARKVNDAYINGKIDTNPYDETLGSFKELITVIVVATAVGLLAYVVWGKL